MTDPVVRLDKDFVQAPHPVLDELRAQCPVGTVRGITDNPLWILTRDADVRRALIDPRFALQGKDITANTVGKRAMDISLMNYDPPLVTEVRRIAIPFLTATRLTRFRPALQRIARDLLSALPTGRADLVPGFTAPFPFLVLCEVFGIAEADRPMLHAWMRTIFDKPRSPATNAVIDRLDEFVTVEIDRRLAEPGPDVWSDIATAWRDQHTVTRPQLISLCGMLLLAGFDSAAQAIANCVIAWLTHAELRAMVDSDPAGVAVAVDEILRRDSPGLFATLRRASTDIEVGSTTIPAGARVLLSLAAANRDPHRYASPEQLDLDRGTGDRHLAFGLGPHFCPGSALATLEVGVALTEFARAFPAARLAVASTDLRWHGSYAGRRLVDLPVWTI